MAANKDMPECLHLVCAHLVGLTWYQGEANDDGEYNSKPEWRCASAFIVDVAGIAWLVTAGHVFTEIDKLKKNPRFKISAARLCDIWSPLSTTTVTVPFDFFDQDVTRYSIDRTDQGLDLAFIPLNRYVSQFLAQTIVPFRRDDWIESDSHDYETYYIIGTPSCLAEDEVTKTETGGTITVTHQPFIVGVNRIDDDGSEADTKGNPQFVARIHDAFPIADIVGMSGGPILGFRRDDKGEFRYWPVAVQSRWLPKKRIVIGTLLAPCLREFEKVLIKRLASEDE